MRNGSLWSNEVFEVISTQIFEFNFETSELDFEVPKSSIWKHTTSCEKRACFFFFHYYLATLTTFYRFVILCICWDTPSEKTGLWQLPIVSSVFKMNHSALWNQVQCSYIISFLGEETSFESKQTHWVNWTDGTILFLWAVIIRVHWDVVSLRKIILWFYSFSMRA